MVAFFVCQIQLSLNGLLPLRKFKQLHPSELILPERWDKKSDQAMKLKSLPCRVLNQHVRLFLEDTVFITELAFFCRVLRPLLNFSSLAPALTPSPRSSQIAERLSQVLRRKISRRLIWCYTSVSERPFASCAPRLSRIFPSHVHLIPRGSM